MAWRHRLLMPPCIKYTSLVGPNLSVCISLLSVFKNLSVEGEESCIIHCHSGIGIWEIFMAEFGIGSKIKQISGGMAELLILETPSSYYHRTISHLNLGVYKFCGIFATIIKRFHDLPNFFCSA